MILVCPSCETRYFAEETALGAEGRRVRCASCGHSWFAKPEGGAAVAAPDASGLTREQVERLRQSAAANAAPGGAPHAEFRARETARRKRARLMAAVLGWTTGAFLFAAAVGAAFVFREQVATAWPQTASAYRMLGLEVNRYGLELTGVSARRSFSGTTPVLTVTGAAANTGDKTRPAPELRFSLRNEAGEEIQSWTDKLPAALILPGTSVEFSSSLTSPPVDAFGLKVTFIGRPGAASDAGADVPHEAIVEAPSPEGADGQPADASPEGPSGDTDEAAGDLPPDADPGLDIEGTEEPDAPAPEPGHSDGGEGHR
jgi:predicted Zn finger-like uncharacterized protein